MNDVMSFGTKLSIPNRFILQFRHYEMRRGRDVSRKKAEETLHYTIYIF